jgi:NitT/TauT family transport system ATP-binding protein
MNATFKVITPVRQERKRRPVLRVECIKKIFRNDRSYLTVLDDISFSAVEGEFICIIGRSGCGKSTLLKILAGFQPPSAGRAYLHGRPVTRPGSDRCVVFQEDALFPWLTVEENISFGIKFRLKNKKRLQNKVEHFLELVGLSAFRHYLPQEISGGMKQRVALARVLILQPQVLLMDEPFAALDAQSRESMQELLLGLWQQLAHTILFVTHDVSEAVTLADRVLVMDKDPGRIRHEATIDLPRPRKREYGEFLDYQRRLHAELRR